MTDFEGSRTVECPDCGVPFNTAEGPVCNCRQEEEEDFEDLSMVRCPNCGRFVCDCREE